MPWRSVRRFRRRAAVHPHLCDAELFALAHRVVGDHWPGCDHDRVNAAGNALQVVIAVRALHLVALGLMGTRRSRGLAAA